VKWSFVLALAAALLTRTGLAAGQDLPAGAGEPRLSLVGGPQRAFGETAVKRTFKVEGAGQYDLVWESRIFRGIVDRGSRTVDAPANVTIEMALPEVRARVDMIQHVQLKRDDKVLAEDDFVLGIFSKDALPELGRTTADLPPIGLCDPEMLIAPVLEKAGVKYTPLRTDLQARTLGKQAGPRRPGSTGDVLRADGWDSRVARSRRDRDLPRAELAKERTFRR
jgi:hypothetical protein